MTDELVIGLRKRRDQGSKMAAARIEQDAATIARLEGEVARSSHEMVMHMKNAMRYQARAEAAEAKVAALEGERDALIHDIERIKDSETAYLNASMAAEKTIARLEGERDEARASADVYAGFNDAAEAKLAQAVEVLRGFVTAWGKTYHGASQGDARQAQMDALAKQVDRARAVIDSEDRKGGE